MDLVHHFRDNCSLKLTHEDIEDTIYLHIDLMVEGEMSFPGVKVACVICQLLSSFDVFFFIYSSDDYIDGFQ